MLCVGMPFWTLCVLFVALRVTQQFCDVSDVCLRLKAPFMHRSHARSALMQYINLTDYRADAPRRHAVLDALRPLCGASRHTTVLRCQ
ncbi:hypothetical protein CFN58_23405 [Pseudomonas avellanae]|uniref:Uncharacterized protein n=1 Tax=Pseudomonas avellanae TaxID=46257 RepID=A0A261WEK0_9PSED|nr:hypothetical protein CFN58_23405 [Pseudomonas avellanae]